MKERKVGSINKACVGGKRDLAHIDQFDMVTAGGIAIFGKRLKILNLDFMDSIKNELEVSILGAMVAFTNIGSAAANGSANRSQ